MLLIDRYCLCGLRRVTLMISSQMSRSDLESARKTKERQGHNKCRLQCQIIHTSVLFSPVLRWEWKTHEYAYVYPHPKRVAHEAGNVILMLKEVLGSTLLHISEIDKKQFCSGEPTSVSRRIICDLLTCAICDRVWGHPWFSQKVKVAVENGIDLTMSSIWLVNTIHPVPSKDVLAITYCEQKADVLVQLRCGRQCNIMRVRGSQHRGSKTIQNSEKDFELIDFAPSPFPLLP